MNPSTNWRLMIHGRLPASFNMAIDEALFRLCADGSGGIFPVIRFYQWDRPTLSFGSSQQYLKAVDLEYCKKAGYDVVRRPTGGRAVLHDREVTYCVVARVGEELGNSIQETYRLISEGIIEGLKELGINANTYGKEGAEKGEKLTYLPCFASSTKYEIAFNGKKIVGSAQRRNNLAFLQHGSILLNFDSAELLKAIGAGNESVTDPSDYMTSISEVLGRSTGFEDAVPKIVSGFEKRFSVILEKMDLTEREATVTGFFNDVKYSSEEWNLCK
jgi:lipoate-protein ligase A